MKMVLFKRNSITSKFVKQPFASFFGIFLCCVIGAIDLRAADNVQIASSEGQAPDELKQTIKNAQVLELQLSPDTTPVVVTIGNVTYKIPRKFFYYKPDSNGKIALIPSLVATFPDLAPRMEVVPKCFPSISIGDKPLGCFSVVFALFGPYISPETIFDREKSLFRNKEPIIDKFGYSKYLIGPDDARIEVYTKHYEGNYILFDCKLHGSDGENEAVCTDRISLLDGNSLQFVFGVGGIDLVPQFETKLRQLMEEFRAKETNQ